MKRALLPSDVMKIRITEILLGEEKIGIEPDRRAKFFDGAVPVALKSIGIAQIIVRPGFVRRFQRPRRTRARIWSW